MIGVVVGLLHGERFGRIPVRTVHWKLYAVVGVLSEVILLELGARGEGPNFFG
jgi:hypothetical protein